MYGKEEVKMKVTKIVGAVVLVLLLLTGLTVKNAGAFIVNDQFSIDGFARYEFGIHTGQANPNHVNGDNFDLTLSRFFLQTEWKYKPSQYFSLFANIRATEDTTTLWDNHLANYNAFPVDVTKNKGLMMRMGHTDNFRAEVWELYSDINVGRLWVRAGKQQIAWGEMIGFRILDCINALDYSWNMAFEPEEFELIRIPAWSIRSIYQVDTSCAGVDWLSDATIEAFINPMDWYANTMADSNAPFQLLPDSTFNVPYINIDYKDRRGGNGTQWGLRLGAKVGPVYMTLNYLSLYAQDFALQFEGFHYDQHRGIPFFAALGDFNPYVMDMNAVYPRINVFGVSANYSLGDPLNAAISFEGLYIPDQPYTATIGGFPGVVDQGTFKYAIAISRPTSLLPATFMHADYANITFEFKQEIYQGDWRRIGKDAGTSENFVLAITQGLLYSDLTPGFQVVLDPRGSTSYYLRPNLKYKYGDHWYFDVWATILNGDPDGAFGALNWADTVYGRVTFQF